MTLWVGGLRSLGYKNKTDVRLRVRQGKKRKFGVGDLLLQLKRGGGTLIRD